jgi:hypothetical protein
MDAKKMKNEETVLFKAKGILMEMLAQYPDLDYMHISFSCDKTVWISVKAKAGEKTLLDGTIRSDGYEDN